MTRDIVESELGAEIQCAKCREFWPLDAEFYFFNKGRPHSWCKACYMADPKTIAKRERWRLRVAKGVRPAPPSLTTAALCPGFPFHIP